MTNINIKTCRSHEYIVKKIKDILKNSYSYSYALVLFDILEIDAFDEIFDKLLSDHELLEKRLSNLKKLNGIIINNKSNNNLSYEEIKNTMGNKRDRLNDLVKLFAKMAIGFDFAHPMEMKEKENGTFSSDSLKNTNFSDPKIKKNDIKGIDFKSSTDKIEKKTKLLINSIHNGIKGTIPSDNYRNNLISILTKSNFQIEEHYSGKLKKILKVIELIGYKNMSHNVFGNLSLKNKRYLDTEHIIPRSSNDDKEENKEKIWKLGNASLLERYINRPMGNPNFNCKQYGCYNKNSTDKECNEKTRKKGKREICYRDSSIRMTRNLLTYNKFTEKEIKKRTKKLANIIVEIVFSDKFDKDYKIS